MTNAYPELRELGDSLESAVAAAILPKPRRARRPRKLVLAIAVLALAIPGIAIGAKLLVRSSDVAASLPAGTKMLQGTDPTCTVVRQDVEYHCVLSRAIPSPEVADLKGTVEPTVDASKHVNGGCRSLTSDGLTWQCYLGQAAVDHQIVGPDLLGVYSSGPGAG
jgi:hypothetical protein